MPPPGEMPPAVPLAEALGGAVPSMARFELRAPLGAGGMGRVIRAWDPVLQREVAIKVPRGESPGPRFVAEARITGQLDHPNIVPVYELGETPDGLPYYAMKEVRGESLRDVLDGLAEEGRHASPWTLHALLSDFVQVCNAVGYAHDRGIVHRDLKPGNIMLGPFGEVFVMDWGLARLVDGEEELAVDGGLRDSFSGFKTVTGAALGTPGYMSLEQAGRDGYEVDARSDVFSLGAILYELLTLQRAYPQPSVLARIFAAAQGPPLDPRERTTGLEIPDEIADLCLTALAREPADRPSSAMELAHGVTGFLEGTKRRERAMQLVEQASMSASRAETQREEAQELRARAGELLADVPSHAPVADKLPGWTMEDRAESLEQAADRARVEFLQHARGALAEVPNLPRAHALLADHYRAEHEAAEAGRDKALADIHLMHLRRHDRGHHAGYLRGVGAVTLLTDRPARVELFRHEVRERRLVAVPRGELGTTPVLQAELEHGSWLLVLRADGCVPVRYPVVVTRDGHWDGVRPGDTDPTPIRLPAEGELGPDDVYVPAGWATSGEPDALVAMPERRLWMDGFVIRRHPVTNAEFIAFLEDLVRAGREELALRVQPHQQAGRLDEAGAPVYGRTEHGGFELVRDSDGDLWRARWPVAMVDWASAAEHARWEAGRTGQPWRLPRELEWEKAARGVDGRRCPWGEFVDPAWACMSGSRPRPMLAEIDEFPDDCSVYGVRGLGGNVKDWCADAWQPDGTPAEGGLPAFEGATDSARRPIRGGHFAAAETLLRSSMRVSIEPRACFSSIGLRLARPFG